MRLPSDLPENRKFQLDAYRAFLAIGVVYAHILIRFPEEDVRHLLFIRDVIASFIVPAFYFLSGSLVYSPVRRISSCPAMVRYMSGKAHRLLVPALVFTLFPFFEDGVNRLSEFTTGYYFLPALFLMVTAYCLLELFIRQYSKRRRGVILVVYAIVTTLTMALLTHLPVGGYFHWRQALHGNLFFILGVLLAMYPDGFGKMFKSWRIIGLCGILFVVCFASAWYVRFPNSIHSLFERVLCPVSGVLFTYGVFDLWFCHHPMSDRMKGISYYLGQRSLPLYVMQDTIFLLVFAAVDTGNLVYPELTALILFPVCVILVLAAYRLLCMIPHAGRLVFGTGPVVDTSVR